MFNQDMHKEWEMEVFNDISSYRIVSYRVAISNPTVLQTLSRLFSPCTKVLISK